MKEGKSTRKGGVTLKPIKGNQSPHDTTGSGDNLVQRQACIDLAGADEVLIFIDGHDDAIIGVADRDGDDVVVYDIKKIVNRLRLRDGMSKGDAEDFFTYNTGGMFSGEQSPMFVNLLQEFSS